MIKNLRHTGIVVNNLEKCLSFYLNIGFNEVSREVETGEYIDRLVGLNNVKLECAKLALKENITLELLKYHSHPYKNNDLPRLSNRVGCSHIALTVSNILECFELISENGGGAINTIQTSPDGKVKVVYCYDPEGNIIEVVEELN
tara:strand:- start:17561 stop:17995 length:435 start_codon:yes stop_codon:yes gene_type:complete